jgi:hypothetical protein
MLEVGDTDLGRFIEPVARALYGDPNPHLSSKTDLRFGSQGSMHVDTAKGTAYSHEDKIGGGVLWLVEREKKLHGAAAFDFLREIGCNVGKPEQAKPVRIVATYDYTDENGALLFQVCRMEPKTFRQRKPDGSWSVRGVRQVPYRLPDVLEAIASDRTIAIVEGEKDADRLWSMSLPATTNAGGAGKWRDDYAEFFRGADVLILCDNDSAGRAHGDQVGQSLVGVASRVRLLDLPGLPVKGDVSDWVDAGGTREQFDALAATSPGWAPRPQPFESKFGAQRWEDIGTVEAGLGYTWFVEDIFPMGEIALAYGDTGTGKSFDMFDMSMAGARGIKWNGHNVERGLVVYVAAEAGKGFAKRKIAYAMQNNLEQAEPLPFVLLTKRPNFFQDDTDVLALVEEIKAICRMYALPLVCIVLDTLSAAAPGMNENASQDVSMVRKRLVLLQETFSACIILVHHKPKGGSTPRGHGSLTADFETTVEFETVVDKKTDTGKTIHKGTVRKQREGKSGISWEFTLPVIEVGRNKWGNPETSCAVAPYNVGAPRTAATGFHATPTERMFMRALYDALVDHAVAPPVGLPKSITKVVEQIHVRTLMRDRTISAHEDYDQANNRFRVAFKRAGDKLRDGGVIGVQGALLWPTGKLVNGFSEAS